MSKIKMSQMPKNLKIEKMNKYASVSLFAGNFLLLCLLCVSFSPLLGENARRWDGIPWVMIVCGVLMPVAAGALFFLAKHLRALYPLCILLNSLGTVCLLSICFSPRETPSMTFAWLRLLPLLFPLLLFFIRAALQLWLPEKPAAIAAICLLVLNALLGIFCMIRWVRGGGANYLFVFFLLVAEFMHGMLLLFSLLEKDDFIRALRRLTGASFGHALIIAFVVLLLASGGELAEALELLVGESKDGGKSKK